MSEESSSKRTRYLLLLSLLCIVLGTVWFSYWWFWGRFSAYTDDAYVGGNRVMITPQVSGIVIQITADNTDLVEKGRLLVQLDTADYVVALDKSKAELAEIVRRVQQKWETVHALASEITLREAELTKTRQDLEHRQKLVGEGGVSLEDYEHAQANFKSAAASLLLAEHEWQAALVEVENTTLENHPLIEESKNRLRAAYLAWQRCSIVAPVTGVVAQRTVQVGEWVDPAEPLLALVPLDQLWVDANFKEVQLSHLRIGQPATLHSDMYGSEISFHGKVLGLSGGTGSVFSLLPPQNATGNWIKIVQRLPVRISLDLEELKTYPLLLGLSMEVWVDTHNREGIRIPPLKPLKPVYETDVYECQECGAEALIQEIIHDNRMIGRSYAPS